MPEVGVVIPCYNQERYILRAIESVQRQTWTDWELVVVDDGSTDASAVLVEELTAQDERIRLVQQENQGVSRARNRGVQELSPSVRYLLFLDADDMLHPEMLQTLTSYLEQHPEAGAVFCGFTRIDEEDRTIAAPQLFVAHAFVPTLLGFRRLGMDYQGRIPFYTVMADPVNLPSNTLMRRQIFEQVGGWDETVPQPAEDRDLFMKIALFSELHVVPRVLVYYRMHSQQSTKNLAFALQQTARLMRRWVQYWRAQPPSRERTEVLRSWHLSMGRVGAWKSVQAGWRQLRSRRVVPGIRNIIAGVRRYLTSFLPYEWGWMY
ncbi:glycosyltransferase family 2 protein [Rhodothermus profundi]|uniref:Glycosyltransferase involved in cell wall bisynthesis n=1 Tax=Rhodothermus profundi TaxID=633813 RepID=A0A1M6XIA4_9BACT|nr:glycosyltransferase family A protein [Rhodothermus profundi]SHL05760.1 Glycosyltransferase involved in cell wall bisynthesis [Rhodothermus profundi]